MAYKTNCDNIDPDELSIIIDANIDKRGLVGHHLESYNSFTSHGIFQIITQLFKIDVTIQNKRTNTQEDTEIESITVTGTFTDAKMGKPVVPSFHTNKQVDLTPNQARLSRLNYSSPLYISAKFTATAYLVNKGEPRVITGEIHNLKIANIPTMVGSHLCHTYNLPASVKKNMEEDPRDPGGYFIVRGEWVISMRETRLFNSPHIFRNIGHEKEISRLEFISKPGDAFENSSQLIIKYVKNKNIYLTFDSIKYFKMDIPFYIIFRLMGMITDQEICDNIVYGYSTPDHKDVISDRMFQIVEAALTVTDPEFGKAYNITDQGKLLEFFAHQITVFSGKSLSKEDYDANTKKYLMLNIVELMDKWVLPHLGTSADSRHMKLRYLGHLIHKLLLVEYKVVESTDRDHLGAKRIDSAGMSFAKVFKRDYNMTIVMPAKNAFKKAFKSMPFSQVNLAQIFRNAIDAPALEKALIQAIVTGDKELTVKNKTVPNRLASELLIRKNQLNFLASLRTIRIANTSSTKQDQRAVDMRAVHPSYSGKICPLQSAPTGSQVGLVKQMSFGAFVSGASSSELLKDVLRRDPTILKLEHVFPEDIYKLSLTIILVNGTPVGYTQNAPLLVARYRDMRRGYVWHNFTDKTVTRAKSQIDPMTTIHWDTDSNEILFWVDYGRLLHTLIVVRNNGELDPVGRSLFGSSYDPFMDTGFIQDVMISPEHMHGLFNSSITIDYLHEHGIIEYIAAEELENCYVCPDIRYLAGSKTSKPGQLGHIQAHMRNSLRQYTHCEIPVGLLGIPALTCLYAQHNQPPRITYQTNQTRQTCGFYVLNWPYRCDKDAFVQYYAEIPIVKTIVNKYIYPNGVNAVIAIMSKGGFNQEDSLFFNTASSQRGLVKCTSFGFTQAELDKDEKFGTPTAFNTDIKKHVNYSKLVKGFPPEGTIIHNGDPIIGKYIALNKATSKFVYKDTSSIYTGRNPVYVERVLPARDQDGTEFVRIKYSETRELDIGDKFCLTPDHEVLTSVGWVGIASLNRGHVLATLNMRTQELEYHQLTNMYSFECCDEDMLNIFSPHMNITSTMNHKHVVYSGNKLKFKTSEKLLKKRYLFKKNCAPFKSDSTVANEFWLIYGAFVAGYKISKDTNIMTVPASMLTMLTPAIKNYNLVYSVNGKHIQIRLSDILVNLITGLKGELPFYLNSEAAQNIILTLCTNLTPALRDYVQHMALHVGISADTGSNVAFHSFDGIDSTSTTMNIIKYTGMVYCPEVKNHTFYTRRSGVGIWTGNSSRAGQKGVTGMGYSQADMPFSKHGIVPDLVLNPHAFPSRMTIGQLIEQFIGKIATIKGIIPDATIFRETDLEAVGDEFERLGWDRYGNERLFNGTTGSWIDAMIFIGPAYYQRLQKFVSKQIYSISTGPTCVITRQPVEGKANKGGLRIGEMEKDVIISHGAGHFIMEKFRDDSDGFDIYVCNTCGTRPVVNERTNLIICNACRKSGLNPQISKARSTWSSRLFFDELESMNVGVKLTVEPFVYESQQY